MRVVGDSSTHKKVKHIFHGHLSNRATIYEWCVIRCGSKNKRQTHMCVKQDWTTCSYHDNHSRLTSQRDWEWVERGQGYLII